MLTFVFLAAFGFIFSVAVIGFTWLLYQDSQDRKARRQVALTHFRYDPRGNPEYYYNPLTGEYFLPGPGNNPTAPAENIIFHPVRVEQLKKDKPGPVLRSNGQPIIVEELPAISEQIEAEKPLPALPDYDRKLLFALLTAQEGGATPASAIRQVTGATGGRKYQEALRLLKLYQEGVINVDEKA